jgi:tetratricopeptide (TPR) repeat protein
MALPDEETIELHNALMQGASDLLMPYLNFDERRARDSTTPEGRAAVLRGCEMLERVIQLNPENWGALWFLGMALNLLDRPEDAYNAFAGAYCLHQGNPDVGRELVLACLTLGKGPEAVRVSEQVLSLRPDDPGLLANYALALLINGRVPDAVTAITRSLRLNPGDPTSQNVFRVVTECQTGQRSPPSKLGR